MNKITLAALITILSCNALAETTWNTSLQLDEMTEEKVFFASSPITHTTKPQPSPYNDLHSWVYVGCKDDTPWVHFAFSTLPEFSEFQNKLGKKQITTRFKWDDSIKTTTFKQDNGKKYIYNVRHSGHILQWLQAHDELLLEINWYGLGNIYFRYNLENAQKTISETLISCANQTNKNK